MSCGDRGAAGARSPAPADRPSPWHHESYRVAHRSSADGTRKSAARYADRMDRRRVAAIAAASLAPAAIELSRELGMGAPIDVTYAVFATLGTLVLLVALTAVFARAMARGATNAPVFARIATAAIAIGIAEALVAWGLSSAFDLALVSPPHRSITVAVRMGAIDGLLRLGLWALAVVLPFAVDDARARAREAAELRTAAELERLRANLQPHFVFNTLATVAGLVGEDPREARRLIGTLGDLLRDSIDDAGDTRTLAQEIAWLRHYADILETRHRGSIRFLWDIAAVTEGVAIPRLLLQPLVENAVKHGALRRESGGEVTIRTTLAPGRVTCIVEDNGPGLPEAARDGALGLAIVKRRLVLAYANAAAFRLERAGDLTRSVVELPVVQP